METAFGWIGKIVDFLINLLPYLTIVKPTHAGIAFVRGNYIKAIKHNNGIIFPNFVLFMLPRFNRWFTKDYWIVRSGLHLTWPMWTEVMMYPIVRQTINLPPQTLVTKDGKTIVISSIIIYEISNIELILVQTYDPETVIRDVAMGAIKMVVINKSSGEILSETRKIDQELTVAVRKILADRFGVKVIRTMMTDICPSRSFRLWTTPVIESVVEE